MFGKKKKDIKLNEEDIFKIGGDKEDPILNPEIEVELLEVKEDTLDNIEKKGFFSKIFGKKKKDIKMDENDNLDIKKENKVDSNIFDEFDINNELGEEVNYIKKEINKDSYDYLISITNFFKYINILIILILIISFSYISIQNNDTFKKSSLLDPICGIILSDKINYDNCSSIGFLKKQEEANILKLKKKTFEKELNILPKIYEKENLLNSREVIFLLDKGEFRLRPLKILSAFDKLKHDFEPIEKAAIKCSNISISDKNILDLNCYAYSSAWDSKIKGFDATDSNSVEGTSITLASSFLNFLEKQNSQLSLLEKQKSFSIESIANTTNRYTKRTPFSIKMKYSIKIY